MQKKMYKVLAPIQKQNNQGSFFMRVGSGYTNKDDSINLYLDVIPVGLDAGKMKLQIRELDENDLRQRESNRSSVGLDERTGTGVHGVAAGSLGASEALPF